MALTEADVREELARLSFGGLMSVISPEWEVRCAPKVAPWGGTHVVPTVRLHCTLPDRDTGLSVRLTFTMDVRHYWDRGELGRAAYEWLKWLWMHEFDESVMLDGRRVRDVHT